MTKYIDVKGKTEEEAIESALRQLGLDRDEVSVEILERAKSGFLGFGAQPASVRVSYDDGQPEPKPEPVKAPAPAAKPAPAPEKKPEKPAAPKFRPEVLQKEVRAKEAREEKKPAARPAAKPAARPSAPVTEPVSAPEQPLGEECHDEKAERVRTFLTGLLEHMDVPAAIRVYLAEDGRYRVFLDGEKLGALIGRRGETLDAIQQLTNYAVNRSGDKGRARVQVDAENYREKREKSLERLAEKVAAKVVKYRRNVTLEPMNAYERHVIHTALQNTPNVNTFSIGTEPNRRVVVSYDRSKV